MGIYKNIGNAMVPFATEGNQHGEVICRIEDSDNPKLTGETVSPNLRIGDGSLIVIRFIGNDLSTANPTLNVNNTGDYPIYMNGSQLVANSIFHNTELIMVLSVDKWVVANTYGNFNPEDYLPTGGSISVGDNRGVTGNNIYRYLTGIDYMSMIGDYISGAETVNVNWNGRTNLFSITDAPTDGTQVDIPYTNQDIDLTKFTFFVGEYLIGSGSLIRKMVRIYTYTEIFSDYSSYRVIEFSFFANNYSPVIITWLPHNATGMYDSRGIILQSQSYDSSLTTPRVRFLLKGVNINAWLDPII